MRDSGFEGRREWRLGNGEAKGQRRVVEEAITQTTNSLRWGAEAEGRDAGREQEPFSTKRSDSECSVELRVPQGF